MTLVGSVGTEGRFVHLTENDRGFEVFRILG